MDQGLQKTSESIFSKLSKAVVGKSKVDEEVLDELEEVLIGSDLGVETTLKVIKRIEERVARDKYLNASELDLILREEIALLLEENNTQDLLDFDLPADKKPYVILVVGVNGVGKTTTAVNLASSLAMTRRRVLLVDLDPQGNATMGCGVEKNTLERTVGDVLVGDCTVGEAMLMLESPAMSLLPANQDLTAAEVQLLSLTVGRELRLRTALQPVREEFDVILIDCPPSLNMLTVNALVAADSVLVPMQCEYYALEGLTALMSTIEQIRAAVNPSLQIEGVLRTMYDPRNNLATEVSGQLTAHFGDKVFRTIIPRNVRLAEAPSFGKPAILYDANSRGALAYLALAGEMIGRAQGSPAELAAAARATA